MEKGELIVSTKAVHPVRLAIVGASAVFFWIVAYFCFAYPEAFRDLSRSSYGMIANVLGVVMLIIPVVELVAIWQGQKSYVAVYEGCLEGYTAVNASDKSAQAQFQVAYEDVVNVSANRYRLFIHTKYKTYEVQAMKNRDQAMAEIRRRMTGH